MVELVPDDHHARLCRTVPCQKQALADQTVSSTILTLYLDLTFRLWLESPTIDKPASNVRCSSLLGGLRRRPRAPRATRWRNRKRDTRKGKELETRAGNPRWSTEGRTHRANKRPQRSRATAPCDPHAALQSPAWRLFSTRSLTPRVPACSTHRHRSPRQPSQSPGAALRTPAAGKITLSWGTCIACTLASFEASGACSVRLLPTAPQRNHNVQTNPSHSEESYTTPPVRLFGSPKCLAVVRLTTTT
ncbi:hypothetical protein VTI74DRAFT_9964 [Chaetomium olivicolor]